ncbi:alternate-type signal peptide domain-containing protein [Nocardioides bruguierae]|uniref:Alternate-type signal peptide domain-containing protein n=1 Tax=Nocardioides bruguierae TaxID=2945102 RepID=A0A9X2D9Y9_9ACTN|nr:alternate-type signal peptide domain-containing protein [Nocardioides bruguierae]MCM0622080.1 alternate-type signal peptide domain-containing protein [Nocardioides bruguierae]
MPAPSVSHRGRSRRYAYVRSAVAVVVAVLLLLEIRGTLASWSDSVGVGGVTGLAAGSLALTDTTAGTCAAAGWTIDSAEAAPGISFDPVTMALVPGDVLTKSCTFTLDATGEHLRATLATTSPTTTGDLAAELVVGGAFTVGGASVTEVTEANDGETIAATLSITYNGTADNTTQLDTADIGGYTVSLTQVHD